MKCNLFNGILISSLLFGILDIGFFIYGWTTLEDMDYYKDNIYCGSYYDYCFYSNLVFLMSILLVLSLICCYRGCLLGLILVSLATIGLNMGVGLYNFTTKNTLCDYDCETNCHDLDKYGDNLTIFFITNLSYIGIMIIFGICGFLCKFY